MRIAWKVFVISSQGSKWPQLFSGLTEQTCAVISEVFVAHEALKGQRVIVSPAKSSSLPMRWWLLLALCAAERSPNSAKLVHPSKLPLKTRGLQEEIYT